MRRVPGDNSRRLAEVEAGSHSPYVLTAGTTPQTIEEHMADTLLHLPSQEIVIPDYGSVPVVGSASTPVYVLRTENIAFLNAGSAVAWTDMPAALTTFLGAAWIMTKADLAYYSQARLVANVVAVGFAGSKLRPQYSLDAASWASLCDSDGATVTDLSPGGILVSAWGTIASVARADVFLRLVGLDGDGVADPSFGTIMLQVR